MNPASVLVPERLTQNSAIHAVAWDIFKLNVLLPVTTTQAVPRVATTAATFCGKFGHVSRDCPMVDHDSNEKPAKVCYRCREPGHISRDCPTQQANGQEEDESDETTEESSSDESS
ncbi:hypothetical protein BJV82DRAFT_578332 [Fennellomyces sp. T-0311]|nr:hypothetical protein BJV82DRAFT_578332 [Fennellomyces sp. T-0311]